MTEVAARPEAPTRLWPTIREALAGSHHGSYTDGSIDRAIVLLAVPMVLELVLESVVRITIISAEELLELASGRVPVAAHQQIAI